MGKCSYIMFCDEAYNAQPRLRYHHYYGGLLIDERFVDLLENKLRRCATDAALTGEIKWGKVDARSEVQYLRFVDGFFDELAQGYFKVRVLFLDKYLRPDGMVSRSQHEQFYTLYYLFITRAFGWKVAPFEKGLRVRLRFFLDQLPDKGPARSSFKEFFRRVPQTARFSGIQLIVPEDGISEIDSRNHRIAQGTDLIIGALGYRMNQMHKVMGPDGHRGSRTRSKDRVSKHIVARLREFGVKNIGITTGTRGNPLALWNDPVRLWRLEPKSFTLERQWLKKKPRDALH